MSQGGKENWNLESDEWGGKQVWWHTCTSINFTLAQKKTYAQANQTHTKAHMSGMIQPRSFFFLRMSKNWARMWKCLILTVLWMAFNHEDKVRGPYEYCSFVYFVLKEHMWCLRALLGGPHLFIREWEWKRTYASEHKCDISALADFLLRFTTVPRWNPTPLLSCVNTVM